MFGWKLVVPLLLLTSLTACVAPLPETFGNRDTLYQAYTLSALSAGDFDGSITVGELKRHGDFGLGTYDALDGEMVMLDGQNYQVRADGLPHLAEDASETPFAAVTYFETEQTFSVDEAGDCPQLQAQIDSALPTLDAPYAIKVSGEFSTIKVRAPHSQSEPFPTLADALADQTIFESQAISGTMVGFRLPEYMAGANATGYHFHFISDDKQAGGHVLACAAGALTVEVDRLGQIYLDLANDDVQ